MAQSNQPIKKIAVLMAMADEARPLIEQLGMTKSNLLPDYLPFQTYTGALESLEITLVVSGVDPRYQVDNIGTQAATLMSHAVIEALQPDLIISAGTAGGFSKRGAAIGTVYLSHDRFVFHDRRVPLEGFAESGIGHYPAMNVTQMAKDLNLPYGVISTGSSLEKSDRDIAVIERFNAVAKEMEAAAIAWVCWLRQQPFLAVKSITNLLDEPGTSEEQFVENLQYACEQLQCQLIRVLNYCSGKTVSELSTSAD